MKKLLINTDGGARGNPGPASSAFIITGEDGKILVENGCFLGFSTNNEAEYRAVKLALERVKEDFASYLPLEVEVRADSRLVVEQLSGRFKVKNPKLKILFAEIKNLENKIGKVVYLYIPRKDNFLADKLVNQILDKSLK